MPLAAKRNSCSDVDTRLIHRVRGKNLRRRNYGREETEEGVKTERAGHRRRCKLLVAMIQAATARKVEIEMAMRRQMDNRVERRREDVDVTPGTPIFASVGELMPNEL